MNLFTRQRQVSVQFPVERQGREIVLTVNGNYVPAVEGRTSGPPENCYPPEPAEAEIDVVLLGSFPWSESLTEGEYEAAVEALIAAAEEEGPDGPDPDDAYDSRMDRED